MQLVANLSLMFTEMPMLDRLAAARRAGFERVEIQFPYDYDIDDLVAARDEAGVEMVLINLPAGDRENGEAGLTALPGRESDFRSAVDLGLDAARRLGVRKINALAGRPGEAPAALVARTARDNLTFAATKFAGIGAIVLVEPVNPIDVPGFYLNRLQAAVDLITLVDVDTVKLLFDLYHMEQTEPSLSAAIRACAPMIGHVQFADTPGRHEPGTGRIDFTAALRTLKDCGYDGHISAEYRSASGRTADSLEWLDEFKPFMTPIGDQ
jgi:hydroxypyruvate isomerase